MNRRKKVYVAGAFSDNNVLGVLKNIGRGQYYASKIFIARMAPFTPWHDKTFTIDNWDVNFHVSDFYEYSLEWLRVSDAVFVVPNHDGLKDWQDSEGTKKEIEEAHNLNIPVFHELHKLNEWNEKQ